MADDLKQMLSKVQQSKGEKRFHFAYGTGARTDGKGDGALAVGMKKMKEEQLKEDCACKEFFSGFCWAATDGGTIFFQGKGKKLSGILVAKMMISVKKAIGRQYEFALPGEDEERRMEKLAGAEEGASPATGDASAAAPPGPGMEQQFRTRLERVEKLFGALTQRDAARAQPFQPLLNIARKRGEEQKYQVAMPALTELDTRLQAALKAALTAPAAPATAPEQEPTPADEWKERSSGLALMLKQLRDAGSSELGAIVQLIGQAQAAAKNGDYATAHEILNQVDTLSSRALGAARQADAKAAIPVGKVPLEKTRLKWQEVKGRSIDGLGELISALKADGDADAMEIVGILGRISGDFPAQLDQSLLELEQAVRAGDRAKVSQVKTAVTGHVKTFAAFLVANKFYIDCCEENPYEVDIAIFKPLTESLREITASIAAI
jgi:hypothetical protein